MAQHTSLHVSMKGLSNLMMLLGALAGCSAEPPSETTGATSAVQDDLSLSMFCGGKSALECSPNRVCVPILTSGCSTTDHIGLCLERPRECPPVADPVCGCDGATYANLCEAIRAGTSTVHHGACAAPPSCGPGAAKCPGEDTCVGANDARGWDDHAREPSWWHRDGQHEQAATCECKTTKQCATGQHWNSSATVCACEADADPCSNLTCKSGQQCVVQSNGTASCETDPCANVTCKAGDVCVAQSDGTGSCEASPCTGISCKAGQACVVQSDGTAACQ